MKTAIKVLEKEIRKQDTLFSNAGGLNGKNNHAEKALELRLAVKILEKANK